MIVKSPVVPLKRSEEQAKTPICKDLVLQESGQEAPVVKVVDKLFDLALTGRASDIHLEPQGAGLFVRFRVDGGLTTIHKFPKTAQAAIISRIKILALLDISERRLPQDGQIKTLIGGRDIELRISTLPGKYGEKVVIRLLDRSLAIVDLGHLGMNPNTQSRFEMMIDKPQGIILVTGPTGSGKTTTLYSVLNRVQSPLKNIITLEDPIEYELIGTDCDEAGITQVQVHPKIGFTFAAGLRASLRQDPDIIMVGEIRDRETAETAMQAAMTGHLVLSTLHTNGAAEAIGRLRDIGIDSYLISSTILGIMAQRLVRVLCDQCKEPYVLPPRALKSIFTERTISTPLTLYRPKGCARCQHVGYWGRRGIYELLVMSDELKQLIHNGGTQEQIKTLAQSQGMQTLRECGLDLVYQGFTTVEEVFRSTGE